MDIPAVRYAKAGDVSLAYQVVGDGPVDLVFVPGYASNLVWNWQLPSYARFLATLSSFCRLIIVDRRGCGLSDHLSPEDLPPLEVLADDLGLVLDAVGSERAALFGADEGANAVVLFAASHPERVSHLITNTMDPMGDYQPWADGFKSRQEREAYGADLERRLAVGWGTREFALSDPLCGLVNAAPSLAADPKALTWFTALMQLSMSPSGAVALHRIYFATNSQPILASVRVPTLLLHRVDDMVEPVESSRFMASWIPGAQLAQLSGDDHFWFAGDTDSIVDQVQLFLTGARPAHDPRPCTGHCSVQRHRRIDRSGGAARRPCLD